jgi:dihydroorotase-like cyclic amidohydrolase
MGLRQQQRRPTGADLIDASGATLLPGPTDAHVPTRISLLHSALQHGITTKLEMMGHWMAGAVRGNGGER